MIEIDGGYHQTVEQNVLDVKRTEAIEFQGLKVIRFTNEEVIQDIKNVLNKIKAYIRLEES